MKRTRCAAALLLAPGTVLAQCWSPAGSGMEVEKGAYIGDAAVVLDAGDGPALYVGGKFDAIGGVAAANIARWNGAEWSALEGGGTSDGFLKLNPLVMALEVHDDGSGPALYAGGMFTKAGGLEVNGIARWTASGWSALGVGIAGGSPPQVNALHSWDPDGDGPAPALLIAGGWFTSMDGVPALRIAQWDGMAWSALGGGLSDDGSVSWCVGLATFEGHLYAGGTFAYAGGEPASGIARWDGATWAPVGAGVTTDATWNGVYAMTVFNDGVGPALFAAGRFVTAGGVEAANIARWDGAAWSALGAGITGEGTIFGECLAVADDGAGPALFVGGNFTSAGGAPANRIARWNGSGWSPLGDGTNGAVYALAAWDGGGGPALFAGGDFTMADGGAAAGAALWGPCDPCPADCDGSGSLDLFDFLCFVGLFSAGEPGADCDGSGSLNLFDFLCFAGAFAGGCP